MGTKAFLQKGRTKPGIVLPAAAANRVNQAKDRSALIRAAAFEEHMADPLPNIGMSIAAKLVEPDDREPVPVMDVDAYAEAKDRMKQRFLGAAHVEDPVEPEPLQAQKAGAAAGATATLTIERDVKAEPDDLTALTGVGPALSQRLQRFGFQSFAAIAKADATTLNEIPGAKHRGAQWIEEAARLAG